MQKKLTGNKHNQIKTKWVVDVSDTTLSDVQERISELGLNFALAPKPPLTLLTKSLLQLKMV